MPKKELLARLNGFKDHQLINQQDIKHNSHSTKVFPVGVLSINSNPDKLNQHLQDQFTLAFILDKLLVH